jgi:signal transduction histidine kinase
MRFRDLSIGQKLHRISLVAGVAALLPAAIAFAWYDVHTVRELMVRRIQVDAEIIGFNCVAPLLFNDADTATSTLGALRAEPHVEAAGVYSKSGALFASYVRSGESPPPATLDGVAADDARFDSSTLVVVHPIAFQRGTEGVVRIRADLAEVHGRLRQYGLIVVLILGMSLLFATVLSSRVQRVIAAPIQHLADLAARVSVDKDYSVRAVAESQDEIGALIRTFNEMLAQIQERDAALRESHLLLERRVEERTRELAAANKELEAFSYSVSHDLRSPLRAIDGFSRTLLEDYSGKVLDEQGTHYLTRVRVGTRRMSELIDDLLHLARVTRADLARVNVDVTALARGIAAELARSDPERQLEMKIEDGLRVNADPHLLKIVLENLMGNAWKFTARTPHARIAVGRATDDSRALFVRDNGAGFDMTYADKLFGVFQRLHANSEFEGTGIGLATVHRIIVRHGGRIWAEAAVGQGATFHFTLGGAA